MEIRKLEIRRLKEGELGTALKLVWDVFEQEIKPSYSEEGVQEFLKFVNYDFMKEKYDNSEIVFWGAFTDELIGTVAVRPDGHISLFFVKDEYQGLGIGKALFQMMYNYCVEEMHVKKITVNATPQAVAKYIHMGMRQIGNMEERNGIRSVPMEMYASPTLVKPVRFQEKKKQNKLWIVLSVIVVLLIGGLIFAGVKMFRNIYDHVMESDDVVEVPEDIWGGWDGNTDVFGEPEDNTAIPEELTGVDAIEVYEAEKLSYEIVNDAYNFVDDEKINTVIEFSVQYPKISVTDESKVSNDVAQKVNQVIYDCAMETVEEIYLNPSDEVKETVLNSQTPVLVSYVTYKVTYKSDSFISIVMEDQYYKGNQDTYGYDFRTININLIDGTVYEACDLVNIDDNFIKDWLMIMRSEAENENLLSELHKKELIKALKGDNFEGVYDVEYFFDKDGVEIGFSFDYEEGDENDAGYAWVTAPFSYKEIKKFQTDNPIWHEMN